MKTTESVVAGARNRLRVLMGRSDADLEKVERDRVINPLVTIKSPIDGTVISRKIGPGQYVRSDSGEALFAISDLSTMWLKAAVPENDIPLIRVGQEIEVKVTAIPDRVFRAKISAIGAASDAATRRVVVRSELPNPDHQLKAEMFASFKITTSEGSRAPAVPVESIIWDGDVATVWVETAAEGVPAPRRAGRDAAGRHGRDPSRRPRRREGRRARSHLRRQRVAAMTRSAGD